MEEFKIDDNQLSNLLQEALIGCNEDVEEAKELIELYKKDVISNPLGREQYGMLLADSMRLKGQARDRFMKLIVMIGNRVKAKELMDKEQGDGLGGLLSPDRMLAAIERRQGLMQDDEDDDDGE